MTFIAPCCIVLHLKFHRPKNKQKRLINTFTKAHHQNVVDQKYPIPCIMLINLIVQTAIEQLKHEGKTNFVLKKFANIPLVHKILCEQITLETYNSKQCTPAPTKSIVPIELFRAGNWR